MRDIILKTADYLEQHPSEFDFMRTGIPSCGTPGCALGWISVFAGFKKGSYTAALGLLGLEPEAQRFGAIVCSPENKESTYAFYNRLEDLVPGWRWGGPSNKNNGKCARALRLYADKYHPAPAVIPDWQAMSKPDAHTFEPSCAET